MPSMSSITSTWPSHSADAPMPMTGARDAARDLGRDLLDHAFDDDAERAGLGDRPGVGDDLVGLALLAAARAVAAEHVHRLRGQADVADHRNAAMGQELDRRRHRLAALELHRRAAGFLHDPRRPMRTPARARPRSCRTACRPRPAHASCRAPPRRRARTSSPSSPGWSRAGRRSPGPGCRRPAACRNAGRAAAPCASCRRSA